MAQKPKVTAQPEGRQAQVGDRICASCSEPNDPARKFCRRCGNTLTTAQVVQARKLPWWKRIFGGDKQPKQYAAGERIAAMEKGSARKGGGVVGLLKRMFTGLALIRTLLGFAAAAGLVGYIAVPGIHSTVDNFLSGGIPAIIDRIQGLVNPKLTPVRPVSEEASSEVKDHPVSMMFDTFTNTDWQGSDKVPTITVKLKDKVDIGAVIVRPGSSSAFVDLRRPSKLAFDFPDGTSITVDLEDKKDAQTFTSVTAKGVDSFVIRILATNGPESAPISISEIEIFKKG